MSKRPNSEITRPVHDGTSDNPEKRQCVDILDHPDDQEVENYMNMTVPEKAQYINNYYGANEHWVIQYPHKVKARKGINLTPSQEKLYQEYCRLPNPTRENAVYFISQLTHSQIETTGI